MPFNRHKHILQVQRLRIVSYQNRVSSQMEFIPPWVKEREMPPRTAEWQMSNFHLWGSEFSHWSAVMFHLDWNVFVCMSFCERQKSEMKEQRGWKCEDEIKKIGCIILLAIKSSVEESHTVQIYPANVTIFSAYLLHGRCVSRKEHGSPPPSRCTTASHLSQTWRIEKKCAHVTWSWIKTNPTKMYNISRHIQLQGLLHNLTLTSLPIQIIYPQHIPTEYWQLITMLLSLCSISNQQICLL